MADVDREEKRRLRQQQKEEAHEIAQIAKAHRLTDLYTIGAGELLDSATDETPFVIDKAIPAGFITFIAGDKDSAKSWIVYDMILAVMHQRPWLGFEAVETGPVLLLNYDNPTGELGRRVKRMGLDRNDPIYVHSLGANDKRVPEGLPVMLYLPKALEAISSIIDHIAPVLIVIDSFRRSHMLNELSAEDMSMLMAILRTLTARGSALVVIHHTPKNTNEKGEKQKTLRGSGEIAGSADVEIYVEKEKGNDGTAITGKLEFGKTRGWLPTVEEVNFRVFDKGKRTKVELLDVFADLLDLLSKNGPMARRDITKALGLTRAESAHIIGRAAHEGLVDDDIRDGNTRLVGLR